MLQCYILWHISWYYILVEQVADVLYRDYSHLKQRHYSDKLWSFLIYSFTHRVQH